MIGSKSKVARVKSILKDRGTDETLLAGVHAPIGLDIGAEGPEEIAVSIAAELIAARRKTKK
jgi:xanthine dehydrogenase accessory factor